MPAATLGVPSDTHEEVDRVQRMPRGVLPGALVVLGAIVALLIASSAIGRSQAAPTNTKEPTIIYVYPIKVGTTLNADKGAWSGTAPITYTYQWGRCNEDGQACKAITNATGTTYKTVNADVGHTIRVRVTASNNDGKAEAASNASSLIPANPNAPQATAPPLVSGNPVVGQELTATTGGWQGAQPITYSYHWQHCDLAATSCAGNGYSGKNYTVRKADLGKRLRVKVVAKNDAGSTPGLSVPTEVVTESGGGIITLPNGEKSIDVTAIQDNQRLIVDQVKFTPNPVTSRDHAFQVRVKVEDTQNHVVRGALVFIRSTPILCSTPTEAATGTDGWITYNIQPRQDWPLKNGANVQFFVKAYRQGDPTLAGIRGDRLVQVAVGTG